jgi:hypothetical protein
MDLFGINRKIWAWVFKYIFAGFLLFFIFLLLLITWQYVPMRFDVAFLNVKEEIQFVWYKIAFYVHVYSSWIVIIIGFFQFWKWISTHHSYIHKSFGKFYIFTILVFSAPSGLAMSLVANGGWISQSSFTILTILWFYFTYKAYQMARQKNWISHEYYMYRSYALTLSAVSLRLIKWVLANTLELPPMDMYRIVSWAGWVINLILVEIYIRKIKD